MPPRKSKRDREEESDVDEAAAEPVEKVIRKKARPSPAAKAKTPTAKKSTRKAAAPLPEESEEENVAPQPAKSTRKKAAPSAKKSTTKAAALTSPAGKTPASVHTKAMTPPSPEDDEVEEAASTVRVASSRRGSKLVSAEQPRLDARFAAVDDTVHDEDTEPVDPVKNGGVRQGVDWLTNAEGGGTSSRRRAAAHAKSSSAGGSMSSYGQAYDVGDPSSSSAWTRLALPCSYLAAMLLLLLVATGNLPAGPWSSGSSDGMIGFGRPPRRGQELAANVTHHLKGHLAPLLQQLATNANSLAEEKREVANFHAKLDELALERAAVKQRLVEAMAKVDRLMGSKASSSTTKEGKPLNPQEAMVELQEVQHSAAKLEKLVTGHLETLAAAVSNPLVGDGLDDERAYFQAWVDATYRAARPAVSAPNVELVAQPVADAMVAAHVRALAESECSGQPDFALVAHGARVLRHTPTFGVSSKASWLNPFAPATVEAKPPELALRRGATQGQCWPLAGTKGALEVELANDLVPSAITLMHIHPKLAPKGDVSSAPKDFVVYGYPRVLVGGGGAGPSPTSSSSSSSGQHTKNTTTTGYEESQEVEIDGAAEPVAAPTAASSSGKVELLRGTFDSSAGCMTFPVELPAASGPAPVMRRVELEVLNNHGRSELTCLYRFMVHGKPANRKLL